MTLPERSLDGPTYVTLELKWPTGAPPAAGLNSARYDRNRLGRNLIKPGKKTRLLCGVVEDAVAQYSSASMAVNLCLVA